MAQELMSAHDTSQELTSEGGSRRWLGRGRLRRPGGRRPEISLDWWLDVSDEVPPLNSPDNSSITWAAWKATAPERILLSVLRISPNRLPPAAHSQQWLRDHALPGTSSSPPLTSAKNSGTTHRICRIELIQQSCALGLSKPEAGISCVATWSLMPTMVQHEWRWVDEFVVE